MKTLTLSYTTVLAVSDVLAMSSAASQTLSSQARPDAEHFESRAQTSLEARRPVDSSDPAATAGGMTTQPGMTGSSAEPEVSPVQVARTSAAALVGKSVLSPSGAELGTVQEVVRGKGSDSLSAVVAIGESSSEGGEDRVAIPLGDLELRAGRLRAPSFAATEKALEARYDYDPSHYRDFDASVYQLIGSDR